MAEHITLLGSEKVEHASHMMVGAADRMARAADQMEVALRQHQVWADTWLERFEQAVAHMR